MTNSPEITLLPLPSSARSSGSSYAACVAGGKGSFVVVVHNYKDYSAAMRHKLILEISQNESQIRQTKSDLAKNHSLVRIATTSEAAPAPPPQVLHPGANQFSQQCDIQGGFGGFGGRFRRF